MWTARERPIVRDPVKQSLPQESQRPPEVWALGLREPWWLRIDAPTGDLWVGDVGQGLYEEVTIARKGENHGWNGFEGFRSFTDRYAKEGAATSRPSSPITIGSASR